MIAYRLQAERLGDLDRDTQRFLDRVAAGTRNGDELPATGDHLTRHGLQPGTILVREWDGKSQRVMVLDQGFAWNGTTYRSLTQIAFAMTGTRWSGPRFFGLRSHRRSRHDDQTRSAGRSRFTRRRRLAGESGKVSGLRNRRQQQRDA
jgi:hypothetical protein